jgi:hypothetical protein
MGFRLRFIPLHEASTAGVPADRHDRYELTGNGRSDGAPASRSMKRTTQARTERFVFRFDRRGGGAVSSDDSAEELSQEMNVIALTKGEERFIFLYDDARSAETLKVLGRYASDPALSFNWVDAAIVSDKIRRHMRNVPSGAVKVEVIPPMQ